MDLSPSSSSLSSTLQTQSTPPHTSSSSSSSSSTSISLANPIPSTSTSISREQELRRRKKKLKTQPSTAATNYSMSANTSQPKFSWKSDTTQQLYSSKLVAALRHVRNSTPSPSAPRKSRAVREAADKALAIAAKGRTRWSRAILTSKQLKVSFLHKKAKVVKQKQNALSKITRSQPTNILRLKEKGGKDLPGVERKVKTLGRLVPGCRKETLPVILEEATDYIPALEMQIRAMRDLLSRFSALAGNGEGSTSSNSTTEHPPV